MYLYTFLNKKVQYIRFSVSNLYCENVYGNESGPPVEISIERTYTVSQKLLKIDSKEIENVTYLQT
jgi:hypothetical protein